MGRTVKRARRCTGCGEMKIPYSYGLCWRCWTDWRARTGSAPSGRKYATAANTASGPDYTESPAGLEIATFHRENVQQAAAEREARIALYAAQVEANAALYGRHHGALDHAAVVRQRAQLRAKGE